MRRYVWSELAPLLVLALCMGVASLAHAQDLRIGYVDMKRVLDNAPQVVAGRALLDQQFRARNDAIELDESRLSLMESQLAQEQSRLQSLESELSRSRISVSISRVLSRWCSPIDGSSST